MRSIFKHISLSLFVGTHFVHASPQAQLEEAYEAVFSHIYESRCRSFEKCFSDPSLPNGAVIKDFAARNGRKYIAHPTSLIYYVRAALSEQFGLPFIMSDRIKAANPQDRVMDLRFTTEGNLSSSFVAFIPGASEPLFSRNLYKTHSAFMRVSTETVTELYPVKISPQSLRPGTSLYLKNGKVLIIGKSDPQRQFITFIDLTPSAFERTFLSTKKTAQIPVAEMFGEYLQSQLGEGFKSWRPVRLNSEGEAELTPNSELPFYSMEQYSLCKDTNVASAEKCEVAVEIFKALSRAQ